MVGAGFSRNSVPLPGVGTHFPTWIELAQAMFDEIYPRLQDETEEQRKERFNCSDALRLASEYEAMFDRQKLESLIRARIPDTDHQPGDLHSLLLQLPWKDVFTTNYDTLLERTEVPRKSISTGNNSKRSDNRDSSKDHKATWFVSCSVTIHHHRRGFPDIFETLWAVRQHHSTVID